MNLPTLKRLLANARHLLLHMCSIPLEREVLDNFSDLCLEVHKEEAKKSSRFVYMCLADLLDFDTMVKQKAPKQIYDKYIEMNKGSKPNENQLSTFQDIVLSNQQLFVALTYLKLKSFDIDIDFRNVDDTYDEYYELSHNTLMKDIQNVNQ